jgi:5-formyltetrahydrofolate cyclo-ligase
MAIAQQFFQGPYIKKAHHVALYLANDGEVSTLPILKLALQQYKSCYIPVLAQSYLQFVKINLRSSMAKNRFGILEPSDRQQTIAPEALDVVVLPLVAFDTNGNRLGMGAGFYDKTFAFRRHTLTPRLVGLAYDFQRVAKVPSTKLDVKLDEVVTQRHIYLNAGT